MEFVRNVGIWFCFRVIKLGFLLFVRVVGDFYLRKIVLEDLRFVKYMDFMYFCM